MNDVVEDTGQAKASSSNAVVDMAEAEVRVDLKSPEFLLAVAVLAIFAAALFVFKTEQLQTALISALSIAVSYFLNTQRHRKVGPPKE